MERYPGNGGDRQNRVFLWVYQRQAINFENVRRCEREGEREREREREAERLG